MAQLAKRERNLRKTVARASGCLDELSTAQRKVLFARAGLGAAPPRSRTAVARRFDITVKRVVRLERTGLKRLRSLAHRGGCTPPAMTTAPAHTTTTALGDTATRATAASALATTAASAPRRDPSHASKRSKDDPPPSRDVDRRGGEKGGVAGVAETNLPTTGGGGLNLMFPLLLLALAGLAALAAKRREALAFLAPARRHQPPTEPAPKPAAWVPWHKSTMTGPSWHDTPPEVERERDTPGAVEHEPWEPQRSRTRR